MGNKHDGGSGGTLQRKATGDGKGVGMLITDLQDEEMILLLALLGGRFCHFRVHMFCSWNFGVCLDA